MDKTRLNIGSGSSEDVMSSWVNVDITPGEGVDVVADCRNLPFGDASVAAIRSAHMIEHLSRPDLDAFARECFRVLKPGGTLEVIAPAFDSLIATYWPRREQQAIDVEDIVISPLDWLDNALFAQHLHETDYHKQGIYPSKLTRVFSRFELHQFEHRDRPTSRWEIRMTCCKPDVPFCSVVLSTRNKASHLDRTLESIFAQSVPFPFEVIVVDDGSTDKTAQVCGRYPVEYHHIANPRYRNPSTARNVGYRAARGEVVIAQSDDIVHVSPNTIEYLATNLKQGEALLAKVDNWEYLGGKPHKWIMCYCGPTTKRPYFFLGALWRRDLYAIGGSDPDFIEPCFDDNWFADCLTKGLGLTIRYTDAVQGIHQRHQHAPDTHLKEHLSRELYARKVEEAKRTGVWKSTGAPWPMGDVDEQDTTPSVPSATMSKIPRVMHFFWAAERMSWMRYMTLCSFRHHNPDWKMVLHRTKPDGGKGWITAETQDNDTYRGPDYSGRVESLGVEVRDWEPPVAGLAPAHASDLCQWEILSTEGGWYADMDFLWVAPMPENVDADAVFCLSLGFMAIGLFGAVPDCQLFKDVAASARDGYLPGAYQSTGAEAVYRLAGIWPNWPTVNQPGDKALAVLRKRYAGLTIAELPSHTAYPWPYTEVPAIFSEAREPPKGCVGIHWFGGNGVAQTWNRKLTHENYGQFRNTYTMAAANVLN